MSKLSMRREIMKERMRIRSKAVAGTDFVEAGDQTDETIWVASFDIGKKNFAFYIEEFNVSELESLRENESIKLIKDTRKTKGNLKYTGYGPDGVPSDCLQNVLDAVCTNGRTIVHKVVDLTTGSAPGSYLDSVCFYNMNDLLDKYRSYWDKCSYVIIEMQMSFGKKRNPMAMKLGQHCYSWFTVKCGRDLPVFEFPAYHKTQVLGCKKLKGAPLKKGGYRWKSVEKPARKKWSVSKAIQILGLRGELSVLDGLTTVTKKDDLADTLTQLQAFKYLFWVLGDTKY
jgi:hypothetical protein